MSVVLLQAAVVLMLVILAAASADLALRSADRGLGHGRGRGQGAASSAEPAQSPSSGVSSKGPSAEAAEPGFQGEEPDAALVLMACAGLMESGMSHSRALESLAGSVRGRTRHELGFAARGLSLGLPWDEAWGMAPVSGPLTAASALVRDVLGSTASTGAPGRAVMRRAASSFRQTWARTAQAQAERAGIHLLLPLAVCFLPAFMLLGVGLFGLSLLRTVWGGLG